MTEPTDAELLEVIREAARGGAIRRDGSTSLRIARAVLAKWGTPPAVAGEPVAKERFSEPLARVIYAGYLLSNCAFNLAQRPGTEISIGTAQTLSDCRKEWDEACAAYKALPSTPQPTQAQAGAVPLPKSYQGSVLTSSSHDSGCRVLFSFGSVAEAEAWHESIIDRHHGIKGGQHGADT